MVVQALIADSFSAVYRHAQGGLNGTRKTQNSHI